MLSHGFSDHSDEHNNYSLKLIHGKKFYHPDILNVNGKESPLLFNIIVQIPKVVIHNKFSMFASSYTAYEIYSYIKPISHNLDGKTKLFCEERRYNDFCTFYENLKKKFPLSTIPALPSKRALTEKLKDEWVLESRRRQLLIWLQYIVLHGALQRSVLVKSFLSGLSEASIYNDIVLNQTNESQVANQENNLSQLQNEILNTISRSDENSGSYLEKEKLLTGSDTNYSRKQKEIARRDLITISR